MSNSAMPVELNSHDELNLADYLHILSRRRRIFIQAFFLIVAVGVVATMVAKPIYRAEASLLVQQASSRSFSLVDANNPISALLAAVQPDSVPAQLEVLQSKAFLDRAKEEAKITPGRPESKQQVRVSAVPDANVIQITVEGESPRQAANLANAMLDLHLQDMDMVASRGLRRTIEHVRGERAKAAEALAKAERELVEFRSRNRIVQLQVDQQARSKEYVDLQAKVRAAESNIAAARAQIAQLETQLEREPLDNARDSLRENPRVLKLRDKLGDLELERVDLLRQYRPDSPRVRALDELIANVKEQLNAEPTELVVKTYVPNPVRLPLETRLAELRSALQGYEADYNVLKEQFGQSSRQVDALTPVETLLARLERERDLAKSAYERLSERLQDLQIRENADLKLARVVERASEPVSPVRPRKALNIALSVILAIVLATGIAFFQEFLDDRISSPADLQRLSPVPTLGHVPLLPGTEKPLISQLAANSHITEAYRVIRAGVAFAGVDSPLRLLQVTSAAQGDGKTVTCLNVATAMALDGKRVIVVDADLRRPSVHRYLELSGNPGVSEVLANITPLDAALQKTAIENLTVLTAGSLPPNPAELLGSQAFSQLLDNLQQRADVVLVDTPPCLPVADPLIIASQVDGVIVVLHAGHTKKGAFQRLEEMLHRARARIVGVVYNRISSSGQGSYYYHYYYQRDGYYRADADAYLPARANSRSGSRSRNALTRADADTETRPDA